MSPADATPSLPGDLDIERIAKVVYEASHMPGNRPGVAWEDLPDHHRAFWLRRSVAGSALVWEYAYSIGYRAAIAEMQNGSPKPALPDHDPRP